MHARDARFSFPKAFLLSYSTTKTSWVQPANPAFQRILEACPPRSSFLRAVPHTSRRDRDVVFLRVRLRDKSGEALRGCSRVRADRAPFFKGFFYPGRPCRPFFMGREPVKGFPSLGMDIPFLTPQGRPTGRGRYGVLGRAGREEETLSEDGDSSLFREAVPIPFLHGTCPTPG